MPVLAAAAAYALLAPNVDFAPALAWHDGQRLAQLTLLALVTCAVLMPATGHAAWETWASLPRWNRFILGVVLILGLISGFVAPLPRWALLEWSSLVLLGVLALAVAAAWRVSFPVREQILVAVFFVTALAYSVKAVTMYFTMLIVGPEYGLAFTAEELFTGFTNIRFFGHVQTMLLPFLVLPALWWGRTPMRRALFFSIPVVWWMLAIASGTRGSWVALLIGALAAWWFGGKSGRHWTRWQMGALLGGAAAYLFFILWIPDLLARPASFMHRVDDIISLRGRDVLWGLSADLIAQHPWLGIGPMHFARHLSVLAAHPHNAIIQFMVEWGVPAALGITVVWVAGGAGLQSARTPDDICCRAGPAFDGAGGVAGGNHRCFCPGDGRRRHGHARQPDLAGSALRLGCGRLFSGQGSCTGSMAWFRTSVQGSGACGSGRADVERTAGARWAGRADAGAPALAAGRSESQAVAAVLGSGLD